MSTLFERLFENPDEDPISGHTFTGALWLYALGDPKMTKARIQTGFKIEAAGDVSQFNTLMGHIDNAVTPRAKVDVVIGLHFITLISRHEGFLQLYNAAEVSAILAGVSDPGI